MNNTLILQLKAKMFSNFMLFILGCGLLPVIAINLAQTGLILGIAYVTAVILAMLYCQVRANKLLQEAIDELSSSEQGADN